MSLVCFIMVLVEMFKRGETTIAIVSLVLTFCTGIGTLIAFVYGWMNAGKWGIRNVMLVWSGAVVLSVVLGMAMFVVGMTHGMHEMQRLHEQDGFVPEPPEFRLPL